MNIAIVGATGNLGRRIVRQARERGLGVRAFVRSAERAHDLGEGVDVVERDLFALTAEDLAGVDVLASAFGSGFSADPGLNERACETYVALARATGVRAVTILGAGCLFADGAHTLHIFEQEGYSHRLAPISAAATRGLAHLDEAQDVAWTAVCPSLMFDADGSLNPVDEVTLDTSRTVLHNADGASYATYEDVARAMLDIAEHGGYDRQLVCVLSPGGTAA